MIAYGMVKHDRRLVGFVACRFMLDLRMALQLYLRWPWLLQVGVVVASWYLGRLSGWAEVDGSPPWLRVVNG